MMDQSAIAARTGPIFGTYRRRCLMAWAASATVAAIRSTLEACSMARAAAPRRRRPDVEFSVAMRERLTSKTGELAHR